MSIKIEPLKNGKTIMKFIGQNRAESKNFYKKLKTSQNDTNIACDSFFRTEELFDKEKDIIHSGYRCYSPEDIPADESMTEFFKDKTHLFSKVNKFCEFRHKHSILLHKDKSFFATDIIYETNVGNNVRDMIESKLNQGFTLEQTLNIYYSGMVDGCIRDNLIKPAFKMVKNGNPIEYVVNLMERSKLRRATGHQKYSNGMLEFLEQFPYMKNSMVSLNDAGEEIFDSIGAKYYPQIFNISSNEIDSLKILRHCRLKHKDNTLRTDERLVLCALEILNNNKGIFTKSDYKLMKNLASIDQVYTERVKNVYPLLCKGYDSEEILKKYFNGRYIIK